MAIDLSGYSDPWGSIGASPAYGSDFDYSVPSYSYAPTSYTPSGANINWGSSGAYSPQSLPSYGGYDYSYQNPNYDIYTAGSVDSYSPDMGGTVGGLGSIWGGIKDWAGRPAGEEGGATNGDRLISGGITAGIGALTGIMQAKALEKARKKQAQREAERAANAGKVAGQQRLDYLNSLRQDPNFREFTVQAPERNVLASGQGGGYGQSGGEHMFFDPNYLSKITTTPVPLASGGMVGSPDLLNAVRELIHGPADKEHKAGGLSSLVSGAGGGQDDKIDAKLSPGEYVMDADVVSALGDGSSEAGAKKLDKMRQNIRTHKRAAGKHKIPPKAKHVGEYL